MGSDEHLRAALDALVGLGTVPSGEPRRALQQLTTQVSRSAIGHDRALFDLLIGAVAAIGRTSTSSSELLASAAAVEAEHRSAVASTELHAALERWSSLDARLERRWGAPGSADSGS